MAREIFTSGPSASAPDERALEVFDSDTNIENGHTK